MICLSTAHFKADDTYIQLKKDLEYLDLKVGPNKVNATLSFSSLPHPPPVNCSLFLLLPQTSGSTSPIFPLFCALLSTVSMIELTCLLYACKLYIFKCLLCIDNHNVTNVLNIDIKYCMVFFMIPKLCIQFIMFLF